jgi:hypothetical protein
LRHGRHLSSLQLEGCVCVAWLFIHA